jgi:S1-C subfamily serine protease
MRSLQLRTVMSESPNRISEIPLERPVPLLSRLAFIFGFVLTAGILVTFTPQLAKQIAYSWNIGVERAKAEAARQFLAENPLSEQRIALVAQAAAPSVVGIHTIVTRAPEEYGAMRGGTGSLVPEVGSGVIIDAEEGYILTNHHVIANAHAILVRLSDGRESEAEVVGQNRAIDLAVLRIGADELESLPWGDSRQIAVGEQVVAIGSPYALQQTVTSGIISATGRYNATLFMRGTGRGPRPIPHEFLQTDAAINPGNSGGALVDMNGRLIGISTAIISADNGGNSGIGFAIPSFIAKQVYEEIVSLGQAKHGWIGVRLSEVSSFEAQRMNQKKPMGAIIRNFERRGSPARDAGLQIRDTILRWGETEINNPLHLIHLVILTEPGTKETVEVFRNGELLTFEVTIGVRPSNMQ